VVADRDSIVLRSLRVPIQTMRLREIALHVIFAEGAERSMERPRRSNSEYSTV
jgi:hypothetical protein